MSTLLPQAELLSSNELLPHQQSLWQRQGAYVSTHSPFYQALWGSQPVPMDLHDLPLLPLSNKAQLRISQANHPPFGDYLASSQTNVTRLHRTSGTTGQAMNLAMSSTDCEITESVGGRSHSAAGLTANHTVVHCLNYQMWMGGVTDHLTLERTGATVVPFGVGNTSRLVETIREIGITAISCTPSYPTVIERVIAEQFPGLKPRDLGLQLGLFGGEPGLDDSFLRDRIQDTWGLQPRNANYGVSDVFSNFAAQCEHDTRLHFLAADVLYPELIDPESEQSLTIKSGRQGELVLTHLKRECQPLVRMRTGDIIAVDEITPCKCGRKGMRFRVIGRSDDMVVVRGLNIFPTMIAAVIGRFDVLTGDYRIILDTPPPYDTLDVQVELAANRKITGGLSDAVAASIKSKLGARARVSVLQPGSFPVTEGKTKRVIRTYQ